MNDLWAGVMKALAVLLLALSLVGGVIASLIDGTTFYEDAILLALLAIGASVIALPEHLRGDINERSRKA